MSTTNVFCFYLICRTRWILHLAICYFYIDNQNTAHSYQRYPAELWPPLVIWSSFWRAISCSVCIMWFQYAQPTHIPANDFTLFKPSVMVRQQETWECSRKKKRRQARRRPLACKHRCNQCRILNIQNMLINHSTRLWDTMRCNACKNNVCKNKCLWYNTDFYDNVDENEKLIFC